MDKREQYPLPGVHDPGRLRVMAEAPGKLFNRDVYLYDEGYYDSFKARTNEKILTGMIQGLFNEALVRQGLVFHPQECRVFDMGSGPCDTSLRHYLTSGFHSAKVIVRAVDENAQYVGGRDLATGRETPYESCDAFRNFQIAQKEFAARKIALDFRSNQADAFNGCSIANITGGEAIAPNSFDLAFLSHLFYHVAPKEGLSSAQRLDGALGDVARNVLKKDGVAVAYHVARGGAEDHYSFQYFRDTFGSSSQSESRLSNTDAMDTKDPATQIEQSCARQGITCRTVKFDTKLRFSGHLFDDAGKIRSEIVTLFRTPERYTEVLGAPELYEDLKSIYFIVQRAAHELDGDKSETGLANLMAKILAAIEKTTDEHGHYLVTHEKMQLLTHPERSENTQAKADGALLEIEAQIRSLEHAATEAFFRDAGRLRGAV